MPIVKSGKPIYRWSGPDGRWEVFDGHAWMPSKVFARIDGTQADLVRPYGTVVDYNPNERVRQWP